jgi:formamidopyrimidine-DNA glycosylase
MPELPDITVYCEQVEKRVLGKALEEVRLNSPFVLRAAVPPIDAVRGKKVVGVSRLGKRIVLSLEGDLHLVIHLMIAGRLHWVPAPKKPGRGPLAILAFPDGALTLTEAGTKRRASIHLVQGSAALAAMNSGGIEPLTATREEFVARLVGENHTLKRALTDPRLFSGIGNAYSDEILHRAKLSPIAMSRSLGEEEKARLFEATQQVLTEWTQRLRQEGGGEFPEKVTAFREGFAVHGRYGRPCPVCGSPVQRIVYAENETNYCARCQTGGKLLADRSLSRLLKKSWPRSIDELG